MSLWRNAYENQNVIDPLVKKNYKDIIVRDFSGANVKWINHCVKLVLIMKPKRLHCSNNNFFFEIQPKEIPDLIINLVKAIKSDGTTIARSLLAARNDRLYEKTCKANF